MPASAPMAFPSRWRSRTVDQLDTDGLLPGYHLVPATRADLLRRLGRHREAARAYRQALELAGSDADRRFLTRRLDELPR